MLIFRNELGVWVSIVCSDIVNVADRKLAFTQVWRIQGNIGMSGFRKARWVCCKLEAILHPDRRLNEARLLTYFSTSLQLTLSINAIPEGTERVDFFSLSLPSAQTILSLRRVSFNVSHLILLCLVFRLRINIWLYSTTWGWRSFLSFKTNFPEQRKTYIPNPFLG